MDELSAVERIKAASHGLRGTIVESLADPITGALREDDAQLIKLHGSYQQDNRDLREERRLQKLEPAYSFMIRTRLPGGVCTPEQWLALDGIARRYASRPGRPSSCTAYSSANSRRPSRPSTRRSSTRSPPAATSTAMSWRACS
jgi:sulfite reductase (NADPH) hemoprotein beta-component